MKKHYLSGRFELEPERKFECPATGDHCNEGDCKLGQCQIRIAQNFEQKQAAERARRIRQEREKAIREECNQTALRTVPKHKGNRTLRARQVWLANVAREAERLIRLKTR